MSAADRSSAQCDFNPTERSPERTMHTLHATAAAPRIRPAATSPAAGNPGVHRSVAACNAVLWAVIGALLAVSTVAFAGPVDAVACSGASRSDARWVTRLGRPDHRPLSLMATAAEFEADPKSDRGSVGVFAAVDGDRWWAHVRVPEGVTLASLTAHDVAAQRFFIGDGADGMHQLRKAEAAVSGNATLRTAYATYAAAASLTAAADRFLGLATPVFGTKFRLPMPAATGWDWEPLDGGRSSGTVRATGARPSFTTGGAVPVGTDGDAGPGAPAVRPRTAASNPVAPSSGMLTTILGNSGGLVVWQLSRRRKASKRDLQRPVIA